MKRRLRRGLGWALAVALLLTGARAAVASGELVRAAQAGADWRCAEVNGQTGLNVRQGPGVRYPVIVTLDPGAQLEADYSRSEAADGYRWVPVRLDAGEGWVITPRLAPCPQRPAPTQPVPTQTPLSQINHDGTLDRYEIAQVARSVVLIANVRGDHISATGTGTITTPDGLIVTNAHVVEGAQEVAIGILDDINDPPEYRYLADVVGYDADVDVALLAIHRDLDGRAIAPEALSLDYLPVTLQAGEVYRGDVVYIFGYPGIGDDYLVVTSGSIVSVENGLMNGQRMPVWYRTDAEIAPGSSGGLAVNGDGEFVGIPTAVASESETGGRLGGILPAQVALLAVQTEEAALSTAHAALSAVWLDHGATVEGEPGLAIHLALTLHGAAQQDVTLWARFFHDDLASAPLVNPAAPAVYRDAAGVVEVRALVEACCAEAPYDDLVLALPYRALGLSAPGRYPLKIGIGAVGEGWQEWLSWEFVTYTVE